MKRTIFSSIFHSEAENIDKQRINNEIKSSEIEDKQTGRITPLKRPFISLCSRSCCVGFVRAVRF